MLKNYCESYFRAFSNKDISLLSNMFSIDIVLQDWEIYAKGKEKTLDAVQNIFDSVETISVNPINLYEEESTVISELEILVNNKETICVVDIITYDETNKIVSIRAYKG